MQAIGRMTTLAREARCGYCLARQVPCWDMTNASKEREQKFFAVVLPALRAAGYLEYGGQQKLVSETGMSPSTASRLVRGKTIPDIEVFPALARIVGTTTLKLLVLADFLPESELQPQQPLSETDPSQVGSKPFTLEEAADRLGITDELGRAIFFGMVDRIKRSAPDDDQANNTTGGTAAQM